MPQTNSAKKALRKSAKQFAITRIIKATLKTSLKKTRQAASTGKLDEAVLRKTLKDLDKAAQKGLIKKNTASRKKSRLVKMVNKTKASK